MPGALLPAAKMGTLFGVPLPWPLGYTYFGMVPFAAMVFGLMLIVLGLLYVAAGFVAGERGPLRALTGLVPFGTANGLASGLAFALALGLLAGMAPGLLGALAPALIRWDMGRFVLPDTLPSGLAMGLASGVVVGAGAGRMLRLPRGLAPGTIAGVVVGLAAFRLIFGPTAGVGHETDVGVGTEVGLAFGVMCGLAGALGGALLGARASRRRDAAPMEAGGERGRSWPLIGLAAGAAVSLALGAVGWLAGLFTPMLPYYGGFTDCPGAYGCGPQPPASTLQALGVVYVLGLFALGGAVVGGLAGTLARKARHGDTPALHWAGLSAGLVSGLAAGLAIGLQHQLIGGPFLIGPRLQPNPLAGGIGLAGGSAAGLALGAACALALSWSERQPGRRALVFGAALILLGLAVWTLPSWFVPLIALDVP